MHDGVTFRHSHSQTYESPKPSALGAQHHETCASDEHAVRLAAITTAYITNGEIYVVRFLDPSPRLVPECVSTDYCKEMFIFSILPARVCSAITFLCHLRLWIGGCFRSVVLFCKIDEFCWNSQSAVTNSPLKKHEMSSFRE